MKFISPLWHRITRRNRKNPSRLQSRYGTQHQSLTLLEEISQPLILSDRYGFIQYTNREFCELWKYDPEELINQHFSVLLSPAVHEQDIRLFHEVLTGTRITNHQTMVLQKNGTALDVLMSASRIPIGKMIHVLLQFTDVHELIQARDRLDQSQRELVDLYNATNAVLWEASVATRTFRKISATIEDLTGYTPDEWMTPGFIDDITESVNGASDADLFEVIKKSATPATIEVKLRTHRFGVRWLRLEATRKNHGPAHVFNGLIFDITLRKSAEEESQRLLDRLRRSSEMKSEFLAQVSHELRTPVSIILGWIELLTQGRLPQERNPEAYGFIEKNARMQISLIDDLLDLARIEKGTLHNRIEITSINECLQSALGSFQVALRSKGIKLSSKIPNDTINVIGDQSRLTQIFWNLISNAIKFTPQGGAIVIDMEVFRENVEIRIEDTGCGIDPVFLPHIFERFSRENATTKTQGSGLGLGLAIVKALTETHGGTVRVESEGKDRGTTVFLRFPFVSREETEITRTPVAEAPGEMPGLDFLKDLRILVVDDVKDVTEVLKALLAEKGANVRTCGSVPEAFEAVVDFKPQIIISDIAMPGLSGIDLIQKIRALSNEEGGDTPAAALTAFVKSVNEKQLIEAGFNKVLSKPVSSDMLYNSIRDLRSGAPRTVH